MLWQSIDAVEAIGLNLVILAAAVVLFRIAQPDRRFDRAVVSLICLGVLANYLVWRLMISFPVFVPGIATVYQAAFLFCELMVVVTSASSILILMGVTDRSREADAAGARFQARGARPPVDVFICTYNEPQAIVERAILCARDIAYDNATVFVCDDTRRDWLRALCADLGVKYITRPDNEGAKAGNLNNALRHTAGATAGEFILVLDADFCVKPEILSRMVPLFEDERIGLVQTPQAFYNADPVQHNLYATGSLCDDQRAFFDVMQPAKDVADAAFCVGTSFVVRRAAIEASGGFPDGAICEDLNTTYQLARHGYITRWLNEKLSVGISAESIPEYLTQRTRWCLGTIQVGLLPDGPLFGRGYSLTMRLHYLQNLLSWFCKPFILFVLIGPAVLFWTGVPVYETTFASFIAAGIPYLILLWGHTIWISGGRGLPILNEVVQAVVAVAIARTIAVGLTEPFGKPFKVTAKGVDRSKARVHWPLVRLFGGIIVLTLSGLAWTIFEPDAATSTLPIDRANYVWALFAVLVCLLAILALVDRPRDGEARFRIGCDTVINAGGPHRAVALIEMTSTVAFVAGDTAGVTALAVPGVGEIAAQEAGGNETVTRLALIPSEAQRRRLIAHLYAHHDSGVAPTGHLVTTLRQAVRSAIGAPPAGTATPHPPADPATWRPAA